MQSKSLSRAMGIIWITTSLLWAVLGIAGLLYGLNGLENIQAGLSDNLTLAVESLDSVHALVDETTEVISATHQTLRTVQQATHDTGTSLADLRPLIWTTTKVVTIQVPDALEGVQDSMPTLIETAKSVDETLVWLSGFKFTIPNPFGTDWSYDLGVDYHPEVPLDQALEEMSGNLEGLPDDLRDMEEDLDAADANLIILSDDLADLAGDIEIANQQIAEITPQMESIANNIEAIQQSLQATQEAIPKSFETARNIMLVILG